MNKPSKSSYTISPEQKLARSMAAYKAHATRQQTIIAGSTGTLKASATASLKAIVARMAALTPKAKKVRAPKAATVSTLPAAPPSA
jgi:hypothetical protein